MGNGQQRYVTNNDAIEIIGGDRWQHVKNKLERNGSKGIDFQFFSYIIRSRFEKIPNALVECLFNAFCNDPNQSIDIEHFISSLSVLASDNKVMIAKFLYRIYENNMSIVERKRTHDILKVAYGEKLQNKREAMNKFFTEMFDSRKRTEVTLKDFEQYPGRLTLLADWVVIVLKIFVDNPPPKLSALDRKYSHLSEIDEMCKRYDVHKNTCEQLRQLFYARCQKANSRMVNMVIQLSAKAEMSMDTWLQWTVDSGYITSHLARVLFIAKTQSYKQAWRFDDFAEFCMINSIGTLEERVRYVCNAFVRGYKLGVHTNTQSTSDHQQDDEGALKYNLRCMLLMLSDCVYQTSHRTSDLIASPSDATSGSLSPTNASSSTDSPPKVTRSSSQDDGGAGVTSGGKFYSLNGQNQGSHGSLITLRRQSSSQSVSSTAGAGDAASAGASATDLVPETTDLLTLLQSKTKLAPALEQALDVIESTLLSGGEGQSQQQPHSVSETVENYVSLMMKQHPLLPGLRDLSIAACGLFGVEPSSPLLEKEFITELTLRYMKHHTTKTLPHGPEGTEWCIVNKHWIDTWKLNIGQQRLKQQQQQLQQQEEASQSRRRFPTPQLNVGVGSGVGSNSTKAPVRPGAIDNWSIVKKHGARGQLLHGVLLGQDFEIVSPAVYAALQMWYGGGPRISRRVTNNKGLCEIEFFPLCVKILNCDAQGRVANTANLELLFSKNCTIREMTLELCYNKPKLSPSQIRLWNYARESWKEQYILSPELTLAQANIQDGQAVLMEVSLPDGTWPRSQLHSSLDNEENGDKTGEEGTAAAGGTEEGGKGPATTAAAHEGKGKQDSGLEVKKYSQLRASGGLVGLDNLGNTCYLNSSLQALLHTTHLVDYFLSSTYTRDINIHNIDGFKGKLAHSFGKLAMDLYTSKKKCITPRGLYQTIAALRDQFAGNEQHDAHELLAFFLDGLSEDLNLIHKKPYIEQPDSDGRPESELADIWWKNHLLRDHSIIQSLFTGQFQSIMSCTCGYSSARYEPFTCLTVPIPEISHRIITVVVVPLKIENIIQVAVNIEKTGCLEDVLNKVKALQLTGLEVEGDKPLLFLAGELLQARIRSFNSMDRKLESIREGDTIGFFQIRSMPRPRVKKDLEAELAEEDSSEEGGDSPRMVSVLQSTAAILERPMYEKSHWVRVSFTQRTAKLMDGQLFGAGGYDAFLPEPVGISMLEVLPDNMRAGDLYRVIANRMAPFLKAPVKELLIKNKKMKQSDSNKAFAISDAASSTGSSAAAPSPAAPYIGLPESLVDVEPVDTDEVMGGDLIPLEGFTLRLISGGSGKGSSCSRCAWIDRCQGCSIPNRLDFPLILCDGQCIAIDWHYTVFEDLIDNAAAAKVVQHSSVRDEAAGLYDSKIPLFNCLDKFTEKESLEGVVCSKCKDSTKMSKSFTIWRQPPVLLVQIKRFQFDRISRKKLNNFIDFPLDQLDITNYLTPSRKSLIGTGGTRHKTVGSSSFSSSSVVLQTPVKAHPPPPVLYRERSDSTDDNSLDIVVPKVTLAGDTEAEGSEEAISGDEEEDKQLRAANQRLKALALSASEAQEESAPVVAATGNASAVANEYASEMELSDCMEYDLYCAIHHLGAMGGGHYVTTIRKVESSADPSSTGSPYTQGDKWYCYNDHLVSEVEDIEDVSSASAYVLFYMRRDVQTVDFSQLLVSNPTPSPTPLVPDSPVQHSKQYTLRTPGLTKKIESLTAKPSAAASTPSKAAESSSAPQTPPQSRRPGAAAAAAGGRDNGVTSSPGDSRFNMRRNNRTEGKGEEDGCRIA